jgi:hypothetical protein
MKHSRADYNRIQDPAGLIPDCEPVFLLRAQDIHAPDTLRDYASRVYNRGKGNASACHEIRMHAERMEAWQREHGSKIPDAPDSPVGADEDAPPAADLTTKWRCSGCGRLNIGLQFCPTCRATSPLTPDERRAKAAPTPSPDTIDRYPNHDTFESFGASEKAVALVIAVADRQARATYEGWTRDDGMSSQAAINAVSNADGDLLTYIAQLEAAANARPKAGAR